MSSGDLSVRPVTLVAVPAFNEAEVIAAVIEQVRECVTAPFEIVVVDDGSTDATADVARRLGVTVLSLPFNVGVGGAMRTAYLYAHRRGIEQVVQVDADGQHDPRFVDDLIAALTESDIVIGARFAGVGDYEVRGPRRWAMRFLSGALSRLVGVRLTDVTSGFRAVDPGGVQLFATQFPSEYLGDTVESLVVAHRAGLSIQQIPVAMRRRQAGTPSQDFLKSTAYVARALLVLGISLVRQESRSGGPASQTAATEDDRRMPG